jgi:Ca2+-binding EF-hand superfamily protein
MRRQRQVDLDANGDGTITPEEVKAGQLRRADEMHEQFDADGDGKLTVAEMEQTRAARWMDPVTLDGDKNGEISSEEIRASMEQRRQRMRDARAGSSGGLQGPGEASGTP